tara:strand:+ start:292 stop:792 length:501 start_codon:yes stop_codon:yes gene_type:complete
MAELLFITPQEITETTIVGGNVDIDKYTPCILETQLKTIEELLGSELYNKIVNDIEADTLTGDYLILFNDYIKPITKNESVATYILIAPYTLGNGGLFKRTFNGVETIDYKEVERLSQRYSSIAQMYINRFNKWIGLNELAEYKIYQDEVNASENINLNNGWYFGN